MQQKSDQSSNLKILVVLFILLCSLLFSYVNNAFSQITKPKQISGLFVISNAELQNKYTYLGTVEASNLINDDPKYLINRLIEKTKKNYPGATAIIITDDDYTKADAIMIIEEKH